MKQEIAKPAESREHKLTLSELLNMLIDDGMVSSPDADALIASRRGHRQDVHPLQTIGEQNWKSRLPPHHLLSLETLTEWPAQRVGLEYFHIDPLKIDFSAVADIMSSDYAARFGILPVQLNAREVVVATCEPFLREWEGVIQSLLRKDIRRVMASPPDISRYMVEFYNLAKSIKSASKSDRQGISGLASFEQLVELGKANRQFDANDQNIVHIVDWLCVISQ